MRGLKDRFVEELLTGKLAWLLEEIKNNKKLFLSIEKNHINIYYKGVKMLEIKVGGGYTFVIDEKYFISDAMKEEFAIFNRDKKAVGVYQRKFPIILQAIDEAYGSVCAGPEESRQTLATNSPCVLAMDYLFPPAIGQDSVDMFGVHEGKLVAFHHNLGQNIGTVSNAYHNLEKLWEVPAEKETFVQSVQNISANLVALGLLDAPVAISEESLTFVALLSDCEATPEIKSQFQGSLPMKTLIVTESDTIIDMSKAQ